MKSIKNFINESLTQGQLVDLVRKLPNDAQDIYEPLESIIAINSFNLSIIIISLSICNSLSFILPINVLLFFEQLLLFLFIYSRYYTLYFLR